MQTYESAVAAIPPAASLYSAAFPSSPKLTEALQNINGELHRTKSALLWGDGVANTWITVDVKRFGLTNQDLRTIKKA